MLKDSRDQTALALALWNGFHDTATQLLSGGANINDYNNEGHTMLHQAIIKQDTATRLFRWREKQTEMPSTLILAMEFLQIMVSPKVVVTLCYSMSLYMHQVLILHLIYADIPYWHAFGRSDP